MADALINGIDYSWSNINILIAGVATIGVSGISYTDSREITDNFGIGSRVVSRSHGNITTEGSITLHMSELEQLSKEITGGELWNIPEFDIIVSYLPISGISATHILKNCRFKNNGREVSQGDSLIETQIDLAIGKIVWV